MEQLLNMVQVNDINGFNKMQMKLRLLVLTLTCMFSTMVCAHHVLGRPSYSLSDDSNTPPSMQVETQLGDFFITYMVFPAFPEPGIQGRVILYASRRDNGKPFDGQVMFMVKDDKWFGGHGEVLGTQNIDGGVYRQSFIIKNAGDYIISAKFNSGGEPYTIDFPLKIGQTSGIGPLGIALIVIVLVLVTVNVMQRKRLMRGKIQVAQKDSV